MLRYRPKLIKCRMKTSCLLDFDQAVSINSTLEFNEYDFSKFAIPFFDSSLSIDASLRLASAATCVHSPSPFCTRARSVQIKRRKPWPLRAASEDQHGAIRCVVDALDHVIGEDFFATFDDIGRFVAHGIIGRAEAANCSRACAIARWMKSLASAARRALATFKPSEEA